MKKTYPLPPDIRHVFVELKFFAELYSMIIYLCKIIKRYKIQCLRRKYLKTYKNRVCGNISPQF